MVAPNTLLKDGRYLIIEQLGDGGQRTVYKAGDQSLSRMVAIKEAHFSDDDQRQWLAREARLLAGLEKHQSLPMVFDYFAEGSS